ncbi:AzlC family ABC transporter permease [Tropicibacter naphthalenivorans]|uniref:Inner membrane protein YgaZ n=1 Tax=Tropicibacter naphthalenivorans TaxID=441103 RepID=A0A0P1G081_9RHOB|nr:AzlC family ABC transporter permease [Tropicibacter naphthalenivorans]CUH75093.1 Inner membrane protein YgaZ [Tropicibacter naphthalenivorans]SMC46755.1 4-azaleucine resistance probable transporter AzlC [Tropicibacter naphthalenivorans]
MARAQVMSSFWRGVRDGIPFLMVIAPFGTLFGVIATEAGLNVFETLGFSVVVIAGAAQFTAIQLMSENTPVVVVLVSALAVNLRMAMYSASITPHLGPLPLWKRAFVAYFLVDQTYAGAALEYEKRPDMGLAEKFSYFMGIAMPICPPWYVFTLLGAYVGEAIPAELGLDFALPIAFIAMIAPALRTGAHRAAALTATLAALGCAWLPWNLGLIVAALAGMVVGAEVERRTQR